jgi:hypothetical protein
MLKKNLLFDFKTEMDRRRKELYRLCKVAKRVMKKKCSANTC